MDNSNLDRGSSAKISVISKKVSMVLKPTRPAYRDLNNPKPSRKRQLLKQV